MVGKYVLPHLVFVGRAQQRLIVCMDTLAECLRRRPAKPMGSPRVGSNPTGVELMQLAYLDFGGRLAEPWEGCPPEAGGNPAASWPRIGPGVASRLRSAANGFFDVGRHPGRPCASPGRWPYHGGVAPRGKRRSRLGPASPMNRPPRRYLRLRRCPRSRGVCVCV